MGVWGTGLLENDLTSDICQDYVQFVNSEFSHKEIRSKLQKKYLNNLDRNEVHLFWIALAKCQWDYGVLEKDVYENVKNIINKEIDIRYWNELGAEETDIIKRKKVLNNLLSKLGTQKEKPRKIKRIKPTDSIFEKGDVIYFKCDNSKYGAGIVLSHQKKSEFGVNLIGCLNYHRDDMPNLEDLKNSSLLRLNRYVTEPKDFYLYTYAKHYKKFKDRIGSIGKIEVRKKYVNIAGAIYGNWDTLWKYLSTCYENTENLDDLVGLSFSKLVGRKVFGIF